jgi:hypothetical protein
VAANLSAIATLKKIESDGRDANSEEQRILVRYVGWGAFPSVFEQYPARDWKNAASQLRELLTPEEYASARASTPNAHYTSPEVIQSVWAAMEHLGVQPCVHVLEPSMGVGHFFGLMPQGLYPRVGFSCVRDPSLRRKAKNFSKCFSSASARLRALAVAASLIS